MSAGRRAQGVAVGAMVVALVFLVCPARARQRALEPSPQQPSQAPENPSGDQTGQPPQAPQKHNRIFGIVPNYGTLEVGDHPPPLTVGGKFAITAKTAFDPYEFAVAGFSAGIGQAQNSDPSWGQGLQGFGKRYGAAFASQAVGDFMTGAVFPSLLHQDPRYYRLGKGSFLHRFRYSFTRLVFTRTDSGDTQFNYSEWAGNALAAGASNFYRSREERTVSSTLGTFGLQVAVDLVANELKEFWPDVQHRVFPKGN